MSKSSNCDLRAWLKSVDELGELRLLEGANWDLEMGTLTEIVYN
jgi:4-hydroxy-3-polyprenylbenzoate decarboxylase